MLILLTVNRICRTARHTRTHTTRISLLAMCAMGRNQSEISYERSFFAYMPFNEKRKTIETSAVDCVRFSVRANMLESNCRGVCLLCCRYYSYFSH